MTHADALPEDASVRMLAILERMDARLSRLEATVDTLASQAPALAATAADTIDSTLARLGEQGVDVDERIQTSVGTLEVLTRPASARLLARLLERTEDLEALLDLLPQAPGLAATAADTADAVLARLAERGVDIDARAQAALQALELATRPEVNQLLSAAIDNSETLVKLGAVLPQLEGLAATAADTADGLIGQLAADGVDIDARVRGGLRAIELLSRPEVLAALEEGMPKLLELPGLAAAAADTLDGVIGRVLAQGVMVDERLASLITAAEVMTRPETVRLVNTLMSRSEELASLTEVLLESGVFAPEAADMVGNTGAALVATRKEPNGAVGMFGVLRGLSDPDIQRAASFALRFAQRFGQMLRHSPAQAK